MSKMTESELEETLKILYHTDHYLYDCLCIHLRELDKEIIQLKETIKEENESLKEESASLKYTIQQFMKVNERLEKERNELFEDRNMWIEGSKQLDSQVKKYGEALMEIAKETGTPYAKIAMNALVRRSV
jgi:SMC interacting uncharacterized protein involved in chromosome segregation